MKVLVLRLPRTGMQSLADALALVDINPVYHMREVGINDHETKWTELIHKLSASEPISRAHFDAIVSGYEALSDYPAAIFPKALIEAYPKAHIILTTRDEDAWYKSMMQTLIHTFAAEEPDDPHPMNLMARAYCKLCWDGDFEKNGRTLFRRHNEEVKASSRGRNFLEYTAGDGWEPLCKFLGAAVPEGVPYRLNDAWLEYIQENAQDG